MNWQIRYMTPVEYRRAIHALQLNKAQSGRYLGGTSTPPIAIGTATPRCRADALLLRALIHFHEQPKVPPYEGLKAKRAKAEQQPLTFRTRWTPPLDRA